jgi:hypothetical protein
LFCQNIIFRKEGIEIKAGEAVQTAKTLTELTESYKELYYGIKGSSREVAATKKLWREGDKSRLIQIGMALILLPEPTPITPTIGACFIAAGAIQKGIKSRSIYIEDITRNFQSTLKEIVASKYNLQI